mmetsp:Transcript_16790/g.38640  ORF Transcript_16790/g.38640 Transcript_16790/m.38640 type:complete len:353 (-) Transcript_16790:153-1211(-)
MPLTFKGVGSMAATSASHVDSTEVVTLIGFTVTTVARSSDKSDTLATASTWTGAGSMAVTPTGHADPIVVVDPAMSGVATALEGDRFSGKLAILEIAPAFKGVGSMVAKSAVHAASSPGITGSMFADGVICSDVFKCPAKLDTLLVAPIFNGVGSIAVIAISMPFATTSLEEAGSSGTVVLVVELTKSTDVDSVCDKSITSGNEDTVLLFISFATPCGLALAAAFFDSLAPFDVLPSTSVIPLAPPDGAFSWTFVTVLAFATDSLCTEATPVPISTSAPATDAASPTPLVSGSFFTDAFACSEVFVFAFTFLFGFVIGNAIPRTLFFLTSHEIPSTVSFPRRNDMKESKLSG